eukprot:GHUV01022241.1.p2 GENE.GHUV01022241.1~~GHUV01022241.1.p2  ORF type:complete len:112 (+),score=41.40 GHUV01022241.1:1034-1369(+)
MPLLFLVGVCGSRRIMPHCVMHVLADAWSLLYADTTVLARVRPTTKIKKPTMQQTMAGRADRTSSPYSTTTSSRSSTTVAVQTLKQQQQHVHWRQQLQPRAALISASCSGA